MSSGSQGRDRLAAQIPEELRAVLTLAQQFLLMDTVLTVTVSDLRRALCDAAFAERLIQRPEPALPVQQRAFTPRAATEAELAAAAQGAMIAADAAARQAVLNERNRVAREQARREGEALRLQREAESAAAIDRLRQEAVARQEAEAAERQRVASLQEQLRQGMARQRQQPARQTPNRPNASRSGTRNFGEAIRSMAQPAGHRPGHVPVLGGQVVAREESLAQARANRVDIDWNSETMWRRYGRPRTVPAVRISRLTAAEMRDEIENVVKHVLRVFQLYAEDRTVRAVRDDQSALDQAKRWLAIQPAFRALVQEAIRCNVRFSDAANLYIRQFVLGASSTAAAAAGPRSEQAELADFVNHPVRVVTEESVVDTFGRSGRALRLDDD